ncbi:hypothetical protein EC396_09050 [Lutibacter sp. HS1-25]|uniref:hypothetical protein n=1 Tax=Lutibacter sp. HS1-25 TaxID=2485000 RepID=UPI0010105070|nr:hypothetical protein [Lutibacter sp. HS1-25]RXP54522.1 hypothetical protein EC396_09050 [Lutibacter sp. HS1-25]
MKTNTMLPNLIWLIAVLFFATQTVYSQVRRVDEAYCEKLMKESTNDLQQRVNNNTMSLQRANIILEVLDNNCRQASSYNSLADDFEMIFWVINPSYCNNLQYENIYDIFYKYMDPEEYSQEDVEFAKAIVLKNCKENVNSGSKLSLYVLAYEHLISLGINYEPLTQGNNFSLMPIIKSRLKKE